MSELKIFGCTTDELDEAVNEAALFGGAQMFAMSILSDAQELIAMGGESRLETARQYINRAKYVIRTHLASSDAAVDKITIETTDAMGNKAYFRKTERGWCYASASGTPYSFSSWTHDRETRTGIPLRERLERAKTAEEALQAVKDCYHSGPLKASARII